MADKVKMTLPTPKPDFIPGKPGKATRKEPTANKLIEEAIARMKKSERLSDADRAALGKMINPEKPPVPRSSITGKMKPEAKRNFKKGGAVKMKKGGAVCRGAGGVDGGNRGAQFRGVR
jgi:hypothetical protein